MVDLRSEARSEARSVESKKLHPCTATVAMQLLDTHCAILITIWILETTANNKLWILLKMADLYITIIVHNTTSKNENGLLYLPEAAKELLKAGRC